MSESLPNIYIPGVSQETPITTTVAHHVFIIDGSGSMSSCRSATISGFNEQVQNIRQLGTRIPTQQNRVTLVVFNGVADVRYFDADVSSLQELTDLT